MSIDAIIGIVDNESPDGALLHLRPRWDERTQTQTAPGQDCMVLLKPTAHPLPAVGATIWGNAGYVMIGQPDKSEIMYERVGYTHLRDVVPDEGLGEAHVRERLHARCKGVTQKSIADELGISAAHLSDILAGKRGISEDVAAKLGYERRVIFVRQKDGQL